MTTSTVKGEEGAMRRARTWVGVAAALAFALVTAPSHAQGDLVPAARAEGRVVVYGTMAADNFDVIARIFKGRYGVDAEYWRAAPDRLLDRVLSELRARRVMFDVVIGPSYALRLLKRQGAFARYASPSYELFPRPTWDKDGVFSPPYRVTPVGIVYNTRLVRSEEAPRNYLDLTDPRWRGRIGMADPTLSVFSAAWLVNLRKYLGPQWRNFVERLAENLGALEESTLTVASKVGAGEQAVGISHLNFMYLLARAGAPLDYVRADPILADAQVAAVGRNAPHPNAARLFVDTLTSRAGLLALAQAGEFVLVPGIYPPVRDADRLKLVVMEDLDEEGYAQFRQEFGALFRGRRR
jgi:iron(III) transport system substrate-binding protein